MLNGPKPQYINVPHYRKLIERNFDVLSAPSYRLNEILSESTSLVALQKASELALRVLKITGYCFWPALLGAALLGVVVFYAYGGILTLSSIVWFTTRFLAKTKEVNLLKLHETELHCLNEKAQLACSRILLEWDEYCVAFEGYPPDWDERRRAIRERDGHRCTGCGWPKGFSRRSRNLHVHHIVPLNEGGDNSFSNLKTLCHVCHRSEPGVGHERIRYKKKDRRR